MKILLINLSDTYGGGEIYCEKQIRLMTPSFQFCAIVSNKILAQNLQQLGVDTTHTLHISRLTLLFKYTSTAYLIVKALRRQSIACVILHGQAASSFCFLLRLLNRPVIIVRHTTFDLTKSVIKKLLYQFNAYWANSIVCVSRLIARQHFFLQPDKVHYIPNWCNYEPQIPLKVQNCSSSTFITAIFIGRLVKEKGIYELIEAVHSLENVKLLVVGTGPEASELKKIADPQKISFSGFTNQPRLYYEQADIFISASYTEGSPTAVIEAMSLGLPCLLSDIDAHQEISQNGVCAVIFKNKNVNDLQDKLKLLIESEEKRNDIRIKAYEFVKIEYDLRTIQLAYTNLITQTSMKSNY